MVSIKFRTIDDFRKENAAGPLVSGIHSGNAGDLIYSLPAVRAAGIRHLILNVYKDLNPLRKLPEATARALVPLLLAQDYLDRVTLVTAGVPLESVDPRCIDVDYVLDRFRREDTDRLHLMFAHGKALHVEIDPNLPFLQVPAGTESGAEAVLALTPRYRNLSDEFLRSLALYFEDILILAIPEEWRTVTGIPGRVRQCADFLEMAQCIAGAGVFIGSPSLASAIAEGLKAPRMIDLPLDLPNAFPVGPNGCVLPAGRGEFVDVARRLCGSNPRLAALYDDLLHSLEALAGGERPWLRLFQAVPSHRITLDGGGWKQLAPEEDGVFLHPGPRGSEPPRIRFDGLLLDGHNYFEADLSIAHPEGVPVCFQLHLRDKNGLTIQTSSQEVHADAPVRWQVNFPPTYSTVSLELSTVLAPGLESPHYAWAWARRLRLRVV